MFHSHVQAYLPILNSATTRARRQGKIDLATLTDLLGHENLNTTARYLHPDRAGVAAMVEEL